MQFLHETNAKRTKYLPVRGKALSLPIYFPSISSVKTNCSPFEYFKILRALKQNHFLVSAFDVDKSPRKNEFIEALKSNLREDGAIILMDSGNYESYWIRDKTWSLNSFNEILKQEVCDLAFCFDNQFPPKDSAANANEAFRSTGSSQTVTKTTTVIPILHCTKDNLNETVLSLCKTGGTTMVSIPERTLGNGIIERVATVTNLRRELNKLDNYVLIHLLGTGNPHSLMLLSLAGADSFDGLEWCQTTVNSLNGILHHFQLRELVTDSCTFCRSTEFDYTLTTLGHNLIFYSQWMAKIQNAIESKTEMSLLREHFDSDVISKLETIWS